MLGARRPEPLEELAAELGGDERAIAVPCDVAEWDQVQALAAAATERFGQLDAVFANAGFGAKRGFLEESTEHWRSMVLTNVLGVALTIRATLPALLEAGSGHYLITGSVAGRRPLPGSLYSSTKWAVTGMAESLRQELRQMHDNHRIRVTLIEPGMTDTDFFDDRPGPEPCPRRRRHRARLPLRAAAARDRGRQRDPDPAERAGDVVAAPRRASPLDPGEDHSPPSLVAAALAATALALVACGGDTEEKNEYVDEVNEVTSTLNAGLAGIASQGTAGSPEEAGTVFEDFSTQLDAAAADLSDISPPEDVASLHDELVSILEELSAESGNAANEIAAGGAAAVTGVSTGFIGEANSLGAEADATISEINASCRSRRPVSRGPRGAPRGPANRPRLRRASRCGGRGRSASPASSAA